MCTDTLSLATLALNAEDGYATDLVTDVCLLVRGRPFGRPGWFWKNATEKTLRSRATASADLEPPKGLGMGLASKGLGLGSDLSVPTCRIEIDHLHPSRIYWSTRPAFGASLSRALRRTCSRAAVRTDATRTARAVEARDAAGALYTVLGLTPEPPSGHACLG